ncbi:IS5 family transposase [Streptomyces sp. NPDC001260]|uniref:IS5 family transposase n=1 Tax=Streptomyces sp. NPDC001260 TaxID=3364551 RepID=UPI00368EEA2B
MSKRKPYPSDLTDERWALIEPVISAWKALRTSATGHQGAYEMREIVNAILYQNRTGCQWDFLPHDLPPKGATYYYFAAWRDDGTDQKIHDLLRWYSREHKHRLADPSLIVLDTQSKRAAAGVPAVTTGKDAAKKVPGRKLGLAVDGLGLVLAATVVAASSHDNQVGIRLLDKVAEQTGTIKKALVDQGFKSAVVDHGTRLGIDVEVVKRNPVDKGFVPQAKRWIVERAYGILLMYRRLVREYDHRPRSAESRVYWAMTDVMTRRLTSATTLTWRDA